MYKFCNKKLIFFLFIIFIALILIFFKSIIANLSQISNRVPKESIDISYFQVDTSGLTDVTEDVENAMNYAVTNNKLLIISEGIYSVNGLEAPSNLKMKCLNGSVFKLSDNSNLGTRCFSIAGVNNVSILGILTIDGNQENQHNTNEHMHGLFIYNSNDITIDRVDSYNAVGDNVSISGGSDKHNDYSHHININMITAKKAGRKNLVLEHVTKLNINIALLDNTRGGEDGNGGNSLDVEPFNYHGKKKMINSINYLHTIGCGNDFTAGTNEDANKYIMNINTFIVKIIDLPCLVDANNQFNKSAIFSYGITLNIDNMDVYLASKISLLDDGSYTTPSNVFNVCHSAKININTLSVNGGVSNKPIFISSNGYTHSPIVKVRHLIIDGQYHTLDEFLKQ